MLYCINLAKRGWDFLKYSEQQNAVTEIYVGRIRIIDAYFGRTKGPLGSRSNLTETFTLFTKFSSVSDHLESGTLFEGLYFLTLLFITNCHITLDRCNIAIINRSNKL
jgi:hypothetical protein